MNASFPKLDASRPAGVDLIVRPRRRQAVRRSPYAGAVDAALGALFYALFISVLLRVAELAAY